MDLSPDDEREPLFPKTSKVDSSAWRVGAACLGFLADSYDLFTIDLVVLILQEQNGTDAIGPSDKSLMVSMMLAGVVTGQLTFGYIADLIGRKPTFIATAVLTIVGALLSASCMSSKTWFDLPLQLSVCRLLLGIGVGGEYPLAATVTAESAEDVVLRGRLMALVISMQGFGMLLSSTVAVVALSAQASLETTWRLLLAFGAIPSLAAFGLRWPMHESSAFTEDRSRRIAGESSGIAETITAFWRLLLGTASTWFLMNTFQYSIGSFKSTILNDAMSGSSPGRASVLRQAWFAMATSAFAIIGFGAGHVLITRASRFQMQFWGFAATGMVFATVGAWNMSQMPLRGGILLIFLGLMFFFLNSGPNITTFILPAEVFPTRVRATCHGISAASGKVGALVGTALLSPAEAAFGMGPVYFACAILAMLAAFATYLFTPRHSVQLSQLEGSVECADEAQRKQV
jgi:PHS family inorganic phosphate transporter-like MFS transporter